MVEQAAQADLTLEKRCPSLLVLLRPCGCIDHLEGDLHYTASKLRMNKECFGLKKEPTYVRTKDKRSGEEAYKGRRN